MQPEKIYLKDYRPPAYWIDSVDLDFALDEDESFVTSELQLRRNGKASEPLVLSGIEMKLLEISIDETALKSSDYKVDDKSLTILNPPEKFKLKTKVLITPQKNFSMEGLYKSKTMFVTQCEAEGFRRITYYLDRPDVMAMFKTSITADPKKYPVMLSNGNKISDKVLASGLRQVVWEDPFKKPCYLFALVAGDLAVAKDTFKTQSGRKVQLEVYVHHGLENRCQHALDSLKKSMKWDEERFGREYDLDIFMIVATDDFNGGAMENKGLNIFNSRLVLADPETATDDDYFMIEAVIAHEYFHNWTGNRVTVRDWFHLSLKEGLTVFRDEEFSMDMSSAAMVRIDHVKKLRAHQFAEDAGPNAHPIRPESCYSVSNFYTSTIYEKGSEVIRMMQTMVGRPGFRKGMDLYFERFDGQAVIIEDFAKSISDANQKNWEVFKRWYSQAGTPRVKAEGLYDAKSKTYNLKLSQTCPPTPGQDKKEPFHIPLVVGLLSQTGKELELVSSDSEVNTEGQTILNLQKESQTFEFKNVAERPTLSLNRSFSAPIYLETDLGRTDLVNLLQHDSDAFNRWEASQQLYLAQFQTLLKDSSQALQEDFLKTTQMLTAAYKDDPALTVRLLEPPGFDYITQLTGQFDSTSFDAARTKISSAYALKNKEKLSEIYEQFHGKNILSRDPKEFGRRRIKNFALNYLCRYANQTELAYKQFQSAKIMTDQEAALAALVQTQSPLKEKALQEFYDRWNKDYVVMNKWLSFQAHSQGTDTLERVIKLWDHPFFDKKNPNMLYSLLGAFGRNLVRFHDPQNDGYAFVADGMMYVDKFNPQVSARLAGIFNFAMYLKSAQKQKAKKELERIIRSNPSSNLFEIVNNVVKALD